MNLIDIISNNNIVHPIQSKSRQGSIQELLTHLQNLNILSATTLLSSSIEINEKKGSSAVGRGIAYPHTSSYEINELCCVLGLSKVGIDFNSPDGQLCHIILLTLSSVTEPNEHRKLITRFRTMMENPLIRSDLLDTSNNNDVVQIIKKWEDDDLSTLI